MQLTLSAPAKYIRWKSLSQQQHIKHETIQLTSVGKSGAIPDLFHFFILFLLLFEISNQIGDETLPGSSRSLH